MKQSFQSDKLNLNFAVPALFIFIICSAIIVTAIFRQNTERRELRLVETTEQRRDFFLQRIEGDFQILRGVAVGLAEVDLSDESKVIEVLDTVNRGNTFTQMGVAGTDGITDLIDLEGITYKNLNISRTDLFRQVLSGKEVFSEDFYGSEFYAVPVYRSGVVVAVLCAFNKHLLVDDLINVPVFRGDGYFIMMDSRGQFIMPRDRGSENFFDEAYFSEEEKEQFIWELTSPTETLRVFNFKLDDVWQTGVLVSAHMNDWYILSVIPSHSMDSYYNMAAFGTIVVVVFACLLLFFLLYRYIHVFGQSRLELERIAYTDVTTGARNLNKFLMDVNEVLSEYSTDNYAIWMFDIKKFAVVNDIFGNEAGDNLLAEIAQVFRENSPKNSIFCHMSADNFAGLRTYKQKEELLDWFHHLSEAFERRHVISANRMHIEATMGFFCLDFDHVPSSILDMLHRASVAKRYAKQCEGNKAVIFTQEMSEKLRWEAELDTSGRLAIENNELQFFLQPKVSIQNGYKIAGAEALVRWNHPKYGRMSPAEFIPVFENNGFIIQMDRYLFDRICQWFSEYLSAGKAPFNLAVNVSRQGVLLDDFVSYYTSIKRKYNIPDRLIELEFTESVMANDYILFHRKVTALQGNGFICSIDDFGSGYSSLNVIKNLTMDVLKLDAAFFRDGDTARGHIVISSFVKMAKDLSIRTVAEGVEKVEQLEFLKRIGCDMIQGYIFSKPLPVNEFMKLFENGPEIEPN